VPASILDRYEPAAVILVAGAPPHMRPLQQQTWETFTRAYQAGRRAIIKYPSRTWPHSTPLLRTGRRSL
jgi:hypothetical protein